MYGVVWEPLLRVSPVLLVVQGKRACFSSPVLLPDLTALSSPACHLKHHPNPLERWGSLSPGLQQGPGEAVL